MAHSNWCGNPCNECHNPCELDLNMLCSPDCKAIDPKTNMADIEICVECGADLIEISLDEALEIIANRNMIGSFYIKNGKDFYIGIDNQTGDTWIEGFKKQEDCFRWLYSRKMEEYAV